MSLPNHKTPRKGRLEMRDPRNLDNKTEIETGIGEEKLREMLIDKENENEIESGNVREIT